MTDIQIQRMRELPQLMKQTHNSRKKLLLALELKELTAQLINHMPVSSSGKRTVS